MSSRRISLLGAVFFAFSTAGGVGIAQAAPAAGSFLVAARQQQGDFSRSVVFLLTYGKSGAFGLIVNRPTTLPLAKLLPDVRALQGRDDRLYVGGPVSIDHLILLIRAKSAPPDAVHVMDDIYASGSTKALGAVAGGRLAGASFRGYAGYAGWGPGQLDEEIANGDWFVVRADADAVFTDKPGDLWDKLIQTQDTKLVRLGRPDPSRRRIAAAGPL
jgi:putative transcriptional regulator